MSKLRNKKQLRKRVPALPYLEQFKATVLNAMTSKSGQNQWRWRLEGSVALLNRK